MTIRDKVANALVKAIAEGQTREAFDGNLFEVCADFGMPANFGSGQHYTRSNVLTLWEAMAQHRYARNLWLTYKQAQALGAQVRAGSTGVMCVKVLSGTATQVATEDEEGSEAAPKVRHFRTMRPFWLFNIAQIEGLPELPEGFSAQRNIDSVILNIARQGARINYGFNCGAYSVAEDRCMMPNKSQFKSAANYYRAMFHELAHWTGHESRLNRPLGCTKDSDEYALEELVADLASAFCCARLGVTGARIEHHAAYAARYLDQLQAEPTRIFAVVGEADAAYRYLMELAGLEAPNVAKVSSTDSEGYEVLP